MPWWKHNIVLVLAARRSVSSSVKSGYAQAEQRQVFLHGFGNSGIGRGNWNRQGHRRAGELIAQKLCADFFRNAPVRPGGAT